ncbi:response regulator [Butyrivibrio proteoclasticus]|uniref:response regulator n=1 Tax=Butyrivibrio proteoclasticus TaxID=43305 RepID=UPI00054DE4FE|nr:response regulator [Butyrivibrio proteoclasticus]
MKVFLVEDEFVVREGIKNNVNWEAHGYDFCGEASDGELAYSMIQKLLPDIVITDIKMPFMDGLTLSKMIKAEYPWMEIILLTGYEDFQYAKEAIKIGISCYLSKPISGDNLLKEVDAVAERIQEQRQEREAAKRFEEEMKERTELEKQGLFRSLVTGGKTASDLIEAAKKLSLDLTALRYNILLLKVWSTRHDAFEYSNSVVKAEDGIKAVAEKHGALYFDLNVEGIALLFKADDDGALDENIETAVKELQQIFSEYHHIRYFGGIGQNVERLSEIPETFRWASRAFAHIYLTSDNGFLYGSEESLKSSKDEVTLSEIDPKHIDRKLIREFLRRGDQAEAAFFMMEFIKGMGESAIKSTMLRQYVAMDVYFCATEFVENELGLPRKALDERVEELSPEILSDEARTMEYLTKVLEQAVILREEDTRGHYKDVVKEALSYIEEHYAEENLSLNVLAAQVNVSPNHLSAVFRQQTGQPFIKYLTDYRMNEAKELLSRTNKKSNEIGLMVGYKDPHYFSYLFKKTQGVNPTQYRSRSFAESE